ncbi:hypothetical protein Vafri_9133, partial [Volvox africanus]
KMTWACSSLPAARAKYLARFICFLFLLTKLYRIAANQTSQVAACANGFSEVCSHIDNFSASVVQAVATCDVLTHNQLPLRLLISTTWGAEIANTSSEQQKNTSSAALREQVIKYFQDAQVEATVDIDTSDETQAARNGSWLSSELPQEYAGWTSWLETAATSAAEAQELASTLLLQDPDLQWSDVLPEVRNMVALYGGKLQALPYTVEVPLILYMRDALRSIGAGPARTWPELLTLLRQLQQQDPQQGWNGTDANVGNSSTVTWPGSGFCNVLPSGCSRDADLLISIWASLALPAIRIPTSRGDLKLLMDEQLGGDGTATAAAAVLPLARALQLYSSLMAMTPVDMVHGPCMRPDLTLALRKCAVVLGYGSSLKVAIWKLKEQRRQRLRRRQLTRTAVEEG